MNSSVIHTLLNNLPLRRKNSSSGWISFNAVCCHHRGHNADKRNRGGIKLTGHTVGYSCFNCGFKTGYTVGGPLGIKFRRLLIWLGVSAAEVEALKITALRDRELAGLDPEPIPQTQIETRELPPNSVVLDPQQHTEHADYLRHRHLDPEAFVYFVTDHTEGAMHRRVIVPYTYENKLVGYTARAIDQRRPKYLQSLGMPYVFGSVLQRPEYTWCPVMEGVFDALSVNGMATLGNQVSEAQAEQLDALGKTLVIIPDADQAGDGLIQAAIDYGWSVSWPEWPPDIKDINDAVMRFGQLFVIRHIWATKTSGATQIKLRRKLQKKR